MIELNIRNNFAEVARHLEGVAPKQAEFATMVTMNRAAFEASGALKVKMAQVFDRPTPWVLGSVRYKKATRGNLRVVIDLDYWGNKQTVSVSKVLKAEIEGGPRGMKRFEVALQRRGILPPGMVAVPGAAAKMDNYGNMSSGQIVQILSWFDAFGEVGYKANMTQKQRVRLGKGSKAKGQYGFSYFALTKRRGKLGPGIYQRVDTSFGSAVRPVVAFVSKPTYKARFDFYTIGYNKAMEVLQRDLPKAVAEAVRTAR